MAIDGKLNAAMMPAIPAANCWQVTHTGSWNYSTVNVYTDVSTLSITATTTGKPLLVMLTGDAISMNGTNVAVIAVSVDGGTETVIAQPSGTPECMIAASRLLTGVAAGSHTFKIRLKITGTTPNVSIGMSATDMTTFTILEIGT